MLKGKVFSRYRVETRGFGLTHRLTDGQTDWHVQINTPSASLKGLNEKDLQKDMNAYLQYAKTTQVYDKLLSSSQCS